ncbi:MAG: hypothetical protein M3355_08100 [Actinomycetota bacterium]|nr:hypothetical protein [Actinomycetota bacterium]
MRDGLAGIGAVGAMIACCALLPFAVGAIGGLTLGVALGWGVLAAAVILACLAFIVRRYREKPKR